MADDRYEDELAKAIALSLKESSGQTSSVIEVGVNDAAPHHVDSEEAQFRKELQLAIEASKQDNIGLSSRTVVPATVSTTPTAFLSERAQLERERLARLKRQRPDLHQAATVIVIDDDDDDDEEQMRSAKRQHISSSTHNGARRTNTNASSSTGRAPTASSSHAAATRSTTSGGSDTQSIFWEGELRQTANAHVEPQKDKRPLFRLTEIIHPKEDIEFAIVSAYCWNFPWMYSLFDRRTPVIAVDHSQTGDASIRAILPKWIRTTPFLRNGFGCMHMKFMLLFYRTGRLRVMISTANLIEYDWRDIENTVWVQDVPKRPSPIAVEATQTDFASAMVRVLHGVNVAPALVSHLRNDHPNLPLQRLEDLRTHWDFSKVKARLIPSIAGKHEGWPKVILTGHTCLMKSLIDMGGVTPSNKDLMLECQGSSIGLYSTQWLNEFYCSAKGVSAQTWLDTSKARRAKLPLPPIKIMFPTAQYVRDSKLGEAGGGTMFCRRQQWEGKNFPRELFHQTKSKRGRVLMHSKIILGTFRDKRGTLDHSAAQDSEDDTGADAENKKLVGWLYVGSHNFTPSAWGTLSGSAFSPVLNITNYELGILIPMHTQEETEKVTCWESPPQKYVLGRDEPWIQSESPAFQ